ncbi:MAG: hypothetical protein HYV26_17235, partial [Candidatus Hydrogenedentes bacterium]|nr:hypothetical protein [Candidatus Hydrogenedentota bacterium]
VSAFEDCYWLFSSNKLNHGIMRRRLDEAAYLYRMLKQLDAPRVAELGRFKGGSTFLFAAAGAQVLSLDNNLLGSQPRYVADLQAALQRFHLQDRVVCEIVDALEYPVEPESYDLVFIDFASTRDLAERSFARWWPAVKPGRYLLMCDGKCSPHLDVVDCVSLLDSAQFGGTRLPNTPGAFVVFQKNST